MQILILRKIKSKSFSYYNLLENSALNMFDLQLFLHRNQVENVNDQTKNSFFETIYCSQTF
jgi:hypothetical protein